MSNAGGIGSLAGLVIGGVAAALLTPATFGSSAFFYAAYAGAAIGAAEGAPAVLPRFHCPPGMGTLLSPLLDLPFQLGARDPERGSLDCLGLLLYVLHHGLGIQPEDNGHGDILPSSGTQHLTCVWRQRGGTAQTAWLRKLQPWDILLYHDQDADAALRGTGPSSCSLHCALAVNREALVSSTLTRGVAFHYARAIAQDFGPHVLALLRPKGISAWEPARERALILR